MNVFRQQQLNAAADNELVDEIAYALAVFESRFGTDETCRMLSAAASLRRRSAGAGRSGKYSSAGAAIFAQLRFPAT